MRGVDHGGDTVPIHVPMREALMAMHPHLGCDGGVGCDHTSHDMVISDRDHSVLTHGRMCVRVGQDEGGTAYRCGTDLHTHVLTGDGSGHVWRWYPGYYPERET